MIIPYNSLILDTALSWRSSLKIRSLLSVALIAFLILGTTGYFYITNQKEYLLSQRSKAIKDILGITAESIALNVWNFDTIAAENTLRALKNIDGFCGAAVSTDNHEIFASYAWRKPHDHNHNQMNPDIVRCLIKR